VLRVGAARRIRKRPALRQSEQGGSKLAPPSEYQVKASFLLNFTKFVEWPGRPEASKSSFTICILGEDSFGRLLDYMVEGEQVNGRQSKSAEYPVHQRCGARCCLLLQHIRM